MEPAAGRASASSPAESAQRRERAAIAAQACETCRSRKSKCDEQRPKCGLCRRLNVECQYREPQPTKKDKTLVHILDTLNTINGKLDVIGKTVSPNSFVFDMSSTMSPTSQHSSLGAIATAAERVGQPQRPRLFPHSQTMDSETPQAYEHLTTPHKILLWPYIYMHLTAAGTDIQVDLEYVLQEGTPWFLRHEMAMHPNVLPAMPSFGQENGEQVLVINGQRRVLFPKLTYEIMTNYMTHYFSTYNVLFPIVNYKEFSQDLLPTVARHGFGEGDMDSVIVLLVLALGQVAVEGSYGQRIDVNEGGRRSGIRGGTAEMPPGLDLFNEARKRQGFVNTQCNMENIQIHLLTALYYEATARHLDFWRATSSAALACQVTLKCEPIDWDSPKGCQMKRIYWSANLIENWYHFDLDLPRTGICDHEDQVPLPGDNLEASRQESQSMMCFLAMIALRRHISRIHQIIYEASSSRAEQNEDYGGPPVHVIQELSHQLDSWRHLLPAALQWSDEERFAHPDDGTPHNPKKMMFVPDEGPGRAADYRFNIEISTAQLRSRYYYARFMMYRPFVYKAMHFPELMTAADAGYAGACLQAAMLWPICMSPCRDRKRLLPVLFSWTQNFLGVLLILRMTMEHPVLMRIREQYCDEEEFRLTVLLLLDWIIDMKQMEGIGAWGWKVLKQLYPDALEAAGRFAS